MTPPRWPLLTLLLLGLAWGGPAFAQQDEDGAAAPDAPRAEAAPDTREPVRVTVDAAGGPLDLEERLRDAADAWREAGIETLALEIAAEAPHLVRYAPAERMGPDTVTLTLRRNDADGLEVWVHPRLLQDHPAALLRVVARLAGVEGGAGSLDPALSAEDPAAPSEEDVRRWREARSYPPEDVNRDGAVDFLDLIEVAERYGERGVDLAADIDGSGVVDDADLRRLREAYAFTSPAEEPDSPSESSDTDGR